MVTTNMSTEQKESIKWLMGLASGVLLLFAAVLLNDMRDKINKTYDFVIKHEEQLHRTGADITDVKNELREIRFDVQRAKYQQK